MTKLTGREARGVAAYIYEVCFPRSILREMKQSQEKNVSEEQATCFALLSDHQCFSNSDSCKQPLGDNEIFVKQSPLVR